MHTGTIILLNQQLPCTSCTAPLKVLSSPQDINFGADRICILATNITGFPVSMHMFAANGCSRRKAGLLQVAAAGMMINTMGWVEGLGFQLLLHTITAMKANIVLVVGQDRLLSQLQSKYQVC